MKKLSNWREEHRDEYGDLIGGPKISKKQLKKNLSSNEKDEKITRSESTKCGKGEYFCNDSQKCKPIPEGYHVMPDGMLMKGKKHSVNEVAPPTAKHERMVKHIKKSYKKDGKLSDDEKSIAYATAWKNYNKEEVIHEIAMKKDKKIPLGRKSNPYGKRAIAKMIIKSLAEPARAKAGVTREDYIDELSKSTLASYIEKGARDIAGKANDASIKGMSGKRKEADKGYEKTAKRVAGVSKAAGKLALKGTIYDKSTNEEVEVDEGSAYGLYKGSGKPSGAMKDYLDKRAKKLEADKKKQKPEYRNNPAFDDPSHHSFAKYKTRNEGRFRAEWEAFKLIEREDYIERFENWKNGLVEEGYDVSRWSKEDLVETFITENDLFSSHESIIDALFEADKKGKGSGTKDACYHKVKSRYSVWPSAYASGALVKCRKKGAKNWGNSSKKEDFSNWREDLGLLDENRAAAYTAGMSPEQKAVEMRKISPKVADDAGRAHDRFMFGSRKKGGEGNRKYEKEIRKSIPSDKPNRNKTGRGMPVSYRDSYEKDRDDVIQSKIRQGKGSFKDLGKKK